MLYFIYDLLLTLSTALHDLSNADYVISMERVNRIIKKIRKKRFLNMYACYILNF